MENKNLKEELSTLIASEITKEIADLDNRIDAMDLKIPDDLAASIQQQLNIQPKKPKKHSLQFCLKISCAISFVFVGLCWMRPEGYYGNQKLCL